MIFDSPASETYQWFSTLNAHSKRFASFATQAVTETAPHPRPAMRPLGLRPRPIIRGLRPRLIGVFTVHRRPLYYISMRASPRPFCSANRKCVLTRVVRIVSAFLSLCVIGMKFVVGLFGRSVVLQFWLG